MKKQLTNQTILFKIMRFSVVQCLWLAIFISNAFAHDGKSQNYLDKTISFSLQNTEIQTALSQIEKLAEVKFIYSPSMINAERKISLKVQSQKLSEVLSRLFSPLSINFKNFGNQIILSTNEKVGITIIPTPPSPPVAEPINGKVNDAKGQALPGVSIAVKGTKRGTTSDTNGDFKISADKGETLVFSFIGFKTTEVIIGETNTISLVLAEENSQLNEVVVVGSRFAKARTDVDRPVAVDVISAKDIQTSGQVDLGQSITYTAPSFNAVKFGINDSAPFVDPATLRGLGPDQVLVLVNNKRRHKVSFLSINDGVGKGQVGTDINVVPSLSLKRIEVLRDGAAAQYGSDAIGGVINMELNNASSGGAVTVYTGMGYSKPDLDIKGIIPPKLTTDGKTYNLAANFGLKLGKKGFINTTLTYNHTDGYDRSGPYKAAAGFYVRDAVADAALVAKNGIDLDRAVLGSAENTTYGIFINAGLPLNVNWDLYSFGGFTNKHVVTGVFTRPPSNTKRNALKQFPNGYNPIAPADLNDYSITAGLKGKLGADWNLDFSIGQGANKVDFYAENTVNPSLGDASPTSFYIGQTSVSQTLVNADIAKTFNKNAYPNLSIGAGTEFRYETFAQVAGDEAAWKAGPLFKTKDVGSSGREGFSPATAGNWNRTNVGLYVEAESDITKSFLVGAAIRGENYSDFGSDFSYKLNSRLRIAEPFAIRASISRGFRAPSMVQSHYSNYVNISFDNAGNSIINPVIPATSDLAKLIGVNGLKKETSLDYSAGITSKIGDHFTLTADIYQIDVDNRIMLSGQIDVSKIPAFVAAGFPQNATVFVNAIDTRTNGFEFVANYNNKLGEGKINLNAAFSSMITTLRANRKTDTGVEVADAIATLFITDGLPKDKLIISANYEIKKFGVLLRTSRFGKVSDPTSTLAVKPTDPTAVLYQVFSEKTLIDLAFTYKASKSVGITLGANNLFDIYPDLLQVPQTTNEVIFSRRTNQFGTQGRFLNLAVNYKF
ncbi:TonB-dependent receptor [Arcicella sp. LKC2W]|uniref:TonB-dependent receptor n=1 Tax=Arcicella sp. LKC2W TaxID=2984198 RepID=UPI002B1F81A7|nr:TonB-dependent receptor [Arcicella sp. LKC2W]MEA5458846.1 TonB-dependent receptor [Arcicella sp. LKC2W]